MDVSFLTIASLSFAVALTGAMAPGPLLTYTIIQSAQSRRRGYLMGLWIIAGHAAIEAAIIVLLMAGFSFVLKSPPAVKTISPLPTRRALPPFSWATRPGTWPGTWWSPVLPSGASKSSTQKSMPACWPAAGCLWWGSASISAFRPLFDPYVPQYDQAALGASAVLRDIRSRPATASCPAPCICTQIDSATSELTLIFIEIEIK